MGGSKGRNNSYLLTIIRRLISSAANLEQQAP